MFLYYTILLIYNLRFKKSLSFNSFLQMAWINSRTPELSHEHYERALEALRNSGISTSVLVRVRQNC